MFRPSLDKHVLDVLQLGPKLDVPEDVHAPPVVATMPQNSASRDLPEVLTPEPDVRPNDASAVPEGSVAAVPGLAGPAPDRASPVPAAGERSDADLSEKEPQPLPVRHFTVSPLFFHN